MSFEDSFKQLKEYILDVKAKFLEGHLVNQIASPDVYDLDVKSFCILSHAALEGYFETISLNILSICVKSYKQERKILRPLITLMHFKSKRSKFLEEEWDTKQVNSFDTVFDYNRNLLDDINKAFSSEIHNNHGVSTKYLKKLLFPVSIDFPKDVKWLNSLELLALERGFYAHQFLDKGKIKRSIEPENAWTIVNDCIELANEIKDRAIKIIQ